MDAWVLIAVKVFFAVAVAAPPVLIFLYRWKAVPLRAKEVDNMMACVSEGPDKDACNAAKNALANNPYVSDPQKTFKRYHSVGRYIVPSLALTVLICAFGYIVYSWTNYTLLNERPEATTASPTPAPAPAPSPAKAPELPISARLPGSIVMALVGAYIWSVFQICARSRSSELSPDDLYEIDLGLMAAVPVGIAFSLITNEAWGLRTFMAFAASAFPLRDVRRLFQQYALRKTLESSSSSDSAARPSELHLGTAVEGLSDQTLARLSELGISTVLDMAYCDPIKVMVQSGFSLTVIIDWVDQSLWALYAGELKSKINKLGIRCSLDVCEFVDMHLRAQGKKKEVLEGADKEALDALAQAMGSDPVLTSDLMFRICVDPQVVLLRKLWYPGGVPEAVGG